MTSGKPTLARMFANRFLLAAAVTAVFVMCGLLLLTDYVNLNANRYVLAERLRAVRSVDAEPEFTITLNSRGNPTSGWYQLLDADGHWGLHSPAGPAVPPEQPRWTLAPRVMAEGRLEGRGLLPWEPEPSVWAARRVLRTDTADVPMIIVTWRRESAIRGANATPYYAVVAGMLLAFLVSAVITLRTAGYVRRVVDAVAQSSSRIASGDFAVQLAPQPTEEMDRVSGAINRLARDLARTTADLQAEHRRLEQLERLQRQFVADASHELRAPLTAMRVTLEAWQDGVVRPEEEANALAHLLGETKRLGTLVTRLLDLSRIESGREPVSLAPVSVADIAMQIVNGLGAGRAARVSSDVPDNFPLVLADGDALHRILQNLVENARRFTPLDGSIRIWAEAGAGAARIGVTDTGCGVSPDDLPRIWDRFARAAESRASESSGSGLGLAIVKGLTAAMQGEVGAASPPEGGMTVWIRLPLAAEAPAAV